MPWVANHRRSPPSTAAAARATARDVMAPCTGTPDRQVVQERRPLARVGIMTVAATRCSPTSAVVVAVFAPEKGRDQRDGGQRHCRRHESLCGAGTPTRKSGCDDDAHDGED